MVINSPYVDFYAGNGYHFTDRYVNVSGGYSVCAVGGSGFLFLPQQSALACIGSWNSAGAISRTMLIQVGTSPPSLADPAGERSELPALVVPAGRCSKDQSHRPVRLLTGCIIL